MHFVESDLINLPDACEDFLWNTYFYLVEYVEQQEMNNIYSFMLEENQRIHANQDAVPRFFVKKLEPDDDLNLVRLFFCQPKFCQCVDISFFFIEYSFGLF